MFKRINLSLPIGLEKKLNERMKLKNEVSVQELIRKILERELDGKKQN